MTEIEELERMNYFSDGSTEYLSIDIRGVLLERGKTLWIWAYKPVPIPGGGGRGYTYPCPPTPPYDCTLDNSLKVELAGKLEKKRDDKQDAGRVWIPIQVPDEDLAGACYLLLPTSLLEVSGWGI